MSKKKSPEATYVIEGPPPKTPPVKVSLTREQVLDAARAAVMGPREAQYGNPRDNFEMIAEFWQLILGTDEQITAAQVAQCMIALKLARLVATNHDDSWVDIAGYAACGGEVS